MQYEDRSASGYARRKAQKAIASTYVPTDPPKSLDSSTLTALRQGQQTILRTPITTVCNATAPIERNDPGCCAVTLIEKLEPRGYTTAPIERNTPVRRAPCTPCEEQIPFYSALLFDDIPAYESQFSEAYGKSITLTNPEGSSNSGIILAVPATCDGASYSASVNVNGNKIQIETQNLGLLVTPDVSVNIMVIWVQQELTEEPVVNAIVTNACSSITTPAFLITIEDHAKNPGSLMDMLRKGLEKD